MTLEEFLALPDDGVERELIRGQVRVRGGEDGMTVRNRRHGKAQTKIAKLLDNWLDLQPEPRGEILSGEAGFRLRPDSPNYVGIDVAYVSAELAARNDEDARLLDGAPVLAVEILSPSDKHEDIVEMVELYLEAGSAVWVVDPDFRTVAIHRPGRPLELLTDRQELTMEPELPGFRVAVAKLFS
jgi:Uma2 family endonuclease